MVSFYLVKSLNESLWFLFMFHKKETTSHFYKKNHENTAFGKKKITKTQLLVKKKHPNPSGIPKSFAFWKQKRIEK